MFTFRPQGGTFHLWSSAKKQKDKKKIPENAQEEEMIKTFFQQRGLDLISLRLALLQSNLIRQPGESSVVAMSAQSGSSSSHLREESVRQN